jgi:hypothetical protein
MFYRVTPIAVIGGSFLSGLSGHNISEAAAAGCAVVTGKSNVSTDFIFDIPLIKNMLLYFHELHSGFQVPMSDTSTICWLKCGKQAL